MADSRQNRVHSVSGNNFAPAATMSASQSSDTTQLEGNARQELALMADGRDGGRGDGSESTQVNACMPPHYQTEGEEIVRVVYQSNVNGTMVGVESSLLSPSELEAAYNYGSAPTGYQGEFSAAPQFELQQQQQPSRATSTLPSVAEESSSGAGVQRDGSLAGESGLSGELVEELASKPPSHGADIGVGDTGGHFEQQAHMYTNEKFANHYQEGEQVETNAIYSIVNKHYRPNLDESRGQQDIPALNESFYEPLSTSLADGYSAQATLYNDQSCTFNAENTDTLPLRHRPILNDDLREEDEAGKSHLNGGGIDGPPTIDEVEEINAEIDQILFRQKQGAAESGSFKNNFRKKLGVSVSSNEKDLVAHRQNLKNLQEADAVGELEAEVELEEARSSRKFKRTHSVSFNVGSTRSSRHSVDIRNLPSYLTIKRASIVDVAKGAMSSLMHSFSSGQSVSIVSQRRDSSPDEEPIFEEPIAPTLSLGQRVALVKSSGAEFGTVGWIGQLPDVEDDWIVGVIFDNRIGNCDGAYNGIRYFYAREDYAMFVPLSTLTKTDNYIGRPETGTMLSRMSVSLKPGQLISIQRSSIRLQHCFLNAPHQRVGHDVRAVSNRLHCQCHNCGPCAHLSKQGRTSAIPHFGTHHVPNKKNSLAHAAVEILAHHHHHYHEEEHKEEDYQFGDNAAHACNYVRYSCCQQAGSSGHDFRADCGMVRPELLDNLIHAPRAPHRRSRLTRRRTANGRSNANMQQTGGNQNSSLLEADHGSLKSGGTSELARCESGSASYSSCSSRSSSDEGDARYDRHTNSYQYDSSTYEHGNGFYNTIDSRMSLMDQQRFIYQRESSGFLPGQVTRLSDDEREDESGGLSSRIRRCFDCIRGRGGRRKRKPRKHKLSARNRMIEFRRRQSTFVPSTLAKPQEDFASHGIVINQAPEVDQNSDYSSYPSKSSFSSGSNSPDRGCDIAGQLEPNDNLQQHAMITEQAFPTTNDQLKSSYCLAVESQDPQLGYDDYSLGDTCSSYKKDGQSQESALTDLGYSDALTNSSSDSLKQIVDRSVNEEAPLPESDIPSVIAISPLSSSDSPNEQVDISSPTVSVADHQMEDVSQAMENLDLTSNHDLNEP